MRQIIKKVLFVLPMVALFAACGPGVENPTVEISDFEFDSELPIPPYNAIITNGCDSSNHITDLIGFPYVHPEGGASTGSFWMDLGSFILKNASDVLLNTLKEKGKEKLKAFFFGEDQQTVRFNQIMNELGEINNKMNTLLDIADETLQKVDEIQYNQMHDGFLRFHAHLATLTSLNDEYYNMLSADMSEDSLNLIINQWGDKVVNGNSAPYALTAISTELSDFSYLYNGKDRNLFAVYDMIVFHNTPWENQGYEIRDMFRAATAVELTRTAYMTALYYTVNKSEYSLGNVKNCADWLYKFFSTQGNAVTRRTDKAVCQLDGAHFILDANALYEPTSWTGSCWMNSEQTAFASGVLTATPDVSLNKASQLTEAEIAKLVAYYKSKGVGNNYTILSCLEDGGLVVPDKYKTPFKHNESIPFVIDSYSDVFFISQGTNAETYMTQYNDVFIMLQRYYCVGLPIEGFTMQRGLFGGATPDCSKSYHRYKGDDIDLGGDTYVKEVGFANFLFYKKWKLKGDDLTIQFPGEYFLAFKPGSLVRYTDFDDAQ